MAEYLIQGETLTSIADKIRVLNGVEDEMSPAAMDSNLGEVNDEVESQTGLIVQIASALAEKSSMSLVFSDVTVTDDDAGNVTIS